MTKKAAFLVKISVLVGQLVSVSIGWFGLSLDTIGLGLGKYWSRSIPGPRQCERRSYAWTH